MIRLYKQSIITVALLLLGMLSVKSASASTCRSAADLYVDNGCTYHAEKPYGATVNGFGHVQVKAYAPDGVEKDLGKLIYIAGPYIGDTSIANNNAELDAIYYESLPEELMEFLTENGFNIVVMNYIDNNNDYLQKKAFAMQVAIESIQSYRDNQPSLMLALSMGGTISRYALTTMENEGIDHGVDYWVSFDSPHLGAHTPVAIQALPQFVKKAFKKAEHDNDGSFDSFIDNFLDVLDDLVGWGDAGNWQEQIVAGKRGANDAHIQAAMLLDDTMNQPGVRQVMIQNILVDNKMHPDGISLISEFKALGLPKYTVENIAITNGSSIGENLELGTNKYYSYDSGVKDKLGLRFEGMVLDHNTYREYIPSCIWISYWRGGQYCIPTGFTSGYYPKYFSGKLKYPDASNIFHGQKDTYERDYYLKAGVKLDTSPCSTADFLLTDVMSRIEDGLSLTFEHPDMPLKIHADRNCFIPLLSSLAIDSIAIDSNVRHHTRESLERLSPFDVVWAGDANTEHLEMFDGLSDDLASKVFEAYVGVHSVPVSASQTSQGPKQIYPSSSCSEKFTGGYWGYTNYDISCAGYGVVGKKVVGTSGSYGSSAPFCEISSAQTGKYEVKNGKICSAATIWTK